MDARENEDKQKVSWTHALRQIVINCYKYHGREDLLPVFSEEEAAAAAVAAAAQGGNPGSNPAMGSVGVNPAGHQQQVSNDATEKKPTIIHNVVSNNATNTSVVRKTNIKGDLGGSLGSNPAMGSVGVNPAGHQQQVFYDATEMKPFIMGPSI